jgi:hypothetical protein
MDMDTFHKELNEIKKHLEKYSKKNYKYNTKTIEEEIAKLRYDFNKLLDIFACLADGYTELYLLLQKLSKHG